MHSSPAPSSAHQALSSRSAWVGLDHAAVTTRHLAAAISFYQEVIGLSLRIIEDDPIRRGHRRAMLVDSTGRDVIELIEMPELGHPAVPGRGAIHHIGFRTGRTDWHSLRGRLDAQGYPYDEIDDRLFVRDADGLILEIEVAGAASSGSADPDGIR